MRRGLVRLAFLLPVVSCNSLTADGDRVVLSTSVNPVTFSTGDSTLIVVTVHNVALTTATISASSCETLFEVFDTAGNVVGPGEIADCDAHELPRVLGAGDQYAIGAFWHGTFTGSTTENPTYLPPGTYRVRGRVNINELATPVTGPTITVHVSD